MQTNIPPRFVHIDGPGNERLIRDTRSMGLINTDATAYNAAKAQHADALKRINEEQQQRTTIKTLERDVNNMKADLSDIKDALTLILNRLG